MGTRVIHHGHGPMTSTHTRVKIHEKLPTNTNPNTYQASGSVSKMGETVRVTIDKPLTDHRGDLAGASAGKVEIVDKSPEPPLSREARAAAAAVEEANDARATEAAAKAEVLPARVT